MATPATSVQSPPPAGGSPSGAKPPKQPDRRLRLEDILKLMVADGLVSSVDAEPIARSRTKQYDHPLELIASAKLKSLKPPHKLMTLEWLVEWFAGKLKIAYLHIDPLKIDLGAVTATMSNAYAERFRILPVAVDRLSITVATAEPFVRAWADELEEMLKRDIKFV